ncbi:MAG: 50S ribosomal protein L9 [Patescibacteria group bacterium]|nr:50S ribosomal protein L9 [Patescibacteria group bacterium]
MQVILLKDIRGFGRKNEIKNVADGYAKNYLIPKQLAKESDKTSLSELKNGIAAREEKLRQTKEIIDSITKKLQSDPLVIPVKVGSGGEVFGSVTKDNILKALSERFDWNEAPRPQGRGLLRNSSEAKNPLTRSARSGFSSPSSPGSRPGSRAEENKKMPAGADIENMDRPIKSLGRHKITLKLGGTREEIDVEVVGKEN